MTPRLALRPALAALVVFALGAIAPAALSQTRGANVNVTPKRLALDRNHRSGTIYVYNQGDEAGTFNISLVDRVMLPDGQIISFDDASTKPDQKPYADQLKSAKGVVAISPRQVTLAPGQGQAVRVLASDLPDTPAEFRSHLTVSTLPKRENGTTAEQAAGGADDSFRIIVNSVYGLSMPIIVRAGAPDVRAAIENVQLEVAEMRANPTAPLLPTAVVSFDLVRQGANSLFGDIAVHYADKPNDKPVAIALSVGVYTEIPVRHMRLALDRRPTPGEKVLVTFTDQDTTHGKLLATSVP